MVRPPQATEVPTCVSTVPLTQLSYLKKAPKEFFDTGSLRTSYASDGAMDRLVVRASDSRPEGLGSMPDTTKYPLSTHGVRAR
ncbi:hypothetical protein TNCV_3498001 [Trichonephila clavipes]|nr:hypothetical protein TNCV_3498001 [Trichonephila clavipes]